MASMCSTAQSPRAENAFSRAWAARTWPAPEDAESRRTRGLRVMRRTAALWNFAAWKLRSCGFPGAGRELFQNAASDFLRFAEAREVVLKFVIDGLGFLHAKLVTENHVAKFDGMRKKRVFLEFFESGGGVVVVHQDLP